MKSLLPLVFGFGFLNPQIQELPKSQVQQDSTKTQIECKIRKDYGLDSLGIKFDIFPEKNDVPLWGAYYSWGDSLKINYYNIKKTCKKYSIDFDSTLASVIGHEMSHYRVDKTRERLGLKTKMDSQFLRWMLDEYVGLLKLNEEDNEDNKTKFKYFVDKTSSYLTEIVLEKMVNEGIAEYYGSPEVKPLPMDWLTSIEEIECKQDYINCVYYGGLNLMYPIISSYGDKGIEYVLKNMPKFEDFNDLNGYQKNVLEQLAEQK